MRIASFIAATISGTLAAALFSYDPIRTFAVSCGFLCFVWCADGIAHAIKEAGRGRSE
jgi:hypothetical protein